MNSGGCHTWGAHTCVNKGGGGGATQRKGATLCTKNAPRSLSPRRRLAHRPATATVNNNKVTTPPFVFTAVPLFTHVWCLARPARRAVLERAVLERAVLERAVLERAVLERAVLEREPPPFCSESVVCSSASLLAIRLVDLSFALSLSPLSSSFNTRFAHAVTDTGPGVPLALHPTIFEMRAQADDAAISSQGFGIGLSVSHRLVSLMGGDLTLVSPVVEGKGGSVFGFEVAFKKSTRLADELADADRTDSTSATSASSTEIEGLRVLVVDDAEMNLKLMKRKFVTGAFAALSWTVEVASNGEECLEMAKEGLAKEGRAFGLFVIDEHMGETGGVMLGTEVSRELRKIGSDAVIVGCTANCSEQDRKKSEDSGQNLFWPKPVPAEEAALKDLTRAFAAQRRRGNISL